MNSEMSSASLASFMGGGCDPAWPIPGAWRKQKGKKEGDTDGCSYRMLFKGSAL